MNEVFDWCVTVLYTLAHLLGITYKEINVWIFVIIWPIVSVALVAVIIVQQKRILRLKKLTNQGNRGKNG